MYICKLNEKKITRYTNLKNLYLTNLKIVNNTINKTNNIKFYTNI